ncbi:MAG: arylsulfatase [Acidobacteria bacterium]|nr:arylsulfatase [Acidobacteriota bacterium]
MHRAICVSLAVALLTSPAYATESAAPRPNIVIVLVDDVGFSDIGCYGGEIPTPNLDRLAADGVRFTQFYNTGRCSPTRASLLTGLYPHQAGMGWLDARAEPNSRGFHGKLLPRCVTLAEVLQEAGYFTAMTGKWHLGQQHGTPPWKRGFQRSLNSRFGQIYFPREDDEPLTRVLYLNGNELPKDSPQVGKDWYSTDLFTEWGLKFIDEARAEKKPFFLYLAQDAAHFPLRAPADVIAKYRGKYLAGWDALREARHAKQKQLGVIDPKWALAPRPREVAAWDSLSAEQKDRFDQMMATYAAMIDRIDFAMGTLVAGLRQRGELDNTLILFLHDNGGNAEGGPGGSIKGSGPIGSPRSFVHLGMSWATLNNTPFCRYKHFTHEGGISTPLIAHWPQGISRRGALEKQPGHLVDVLATCLELAGAKYPRQYNGHAIEPLQGVSLVPAFDGKPLARSQPVFWEHEGNRAVRDGRWKLVMRHKLPWQLFDMEADRTEQHDVIEQQPQIAKDLQAAWNAWAQRTYVDDWSEPERTDWGHDISPARK